MDSQAIDNLTQLAWAMALPSFLLGLMVYAICGPTVLRLVGFLLRPLVRPCQRWLAVRAGVQCPRCGGHGLDIEAMRRRNGRA